MKAETLSVASTQAATGTTPFNHREWHLVPDTDHSNCFSLEEAGTGTLLGILVLPEGRDATFLDLIAAAPELQDIAEMYRDSMTGSRAEKSMIFEIVSEVLNRVK